MTTSDSISPDDQNAVTYYAVPDPSDPGLITYWRRDKRGHLTSWPPKQKYRPRLFTRDIPTELKGPARQRWVNDWFREHVHPWQAAIQAAIDADPDLCQARFAAFTSRCHNCGRSLTDPASKVYGVGPECRANYTDELLAARRERMGRAHSEYLALLAAAAEEAA